MSLSTRIPPPPDRSGRAVSSAWALCLTLSTWLAGCGPTRTDAPAPSPDPPAAPPQVLVDAAWLAARTGCPDLVILDTRPAEDYARGHLPGAVHLPANLTYADSDGAAEAAPVRVLNEVFSKAGIGMDTSVVVYGPDDDYRPAAWVFWLLEALGHPAAAVLNGGVPAWVAARQPLSRDAVAPPPATFVAACDPRRLADKLEVCRAMLRGEATILDARSFGEYTGAESARYARGGHIPTAINRPVVEEYVDQDGVCALRTPDRLLASYADLRGSKVYTYCNTGRSAAVSYLALRSLGVDVAVYDGSWSEWSADPSLPVQEGPEPGRPGE